MATPEDFGSQGQLPSHPELLDWLARTFIDSGWDVKRLWRLIVTSATYRQSSDASAELLARDPDNVLLARGPRFRLPAEMIRDKALAASGLLVDTLGGPPVKPYQPAGLWEEKSNIAYQRDVGAGSASPQPLHVLEADLAAAGHAHLRRHQPRGLRRQAAADRHAAPGARAAERPPVRRGRPGPGPAGRPRRRATASPTGSTFIFRTLTGRRPGRPRARRPRGALPRAVRRVPLGPVRRRASSSPSATPRATRRSTRPNAPR